MAQSSSKVSVYLEIGNKRTFAGAVDWPGWCRSGREEGAALRALFDYRLRYARIFRPPGLDFQMPAEVSDLTVVERLEGNATTDFGAPAIAPSPDSGPVNDGQLHRFRKILEGCWDAFDAAVRKAAGRQLRLGPRGGGRDLENIIRHVLESAAGYLAKLPYKLEHTLPADLNEASLFTRQAVLAALAEVAPGSSPGRGPRGGALWTERYFVRRLAWHVLDHAWEIEDRTI